MYMKQLPNDFYNTTFVMRTSRKVSVIQNPSWTA
jgi:hypothetical protein